MTQELEGLGDPLLINIKNEQGIGSGRSYSEREYYTLMENILPNMAVRSAPLDFRLLKALLDGGFKYVGDILERSEEELKDIKGIGEKFYERLIQRLQESNYLPPEETSEVQVDSDRGRFEEPKVFKAVEGASTSFD